MMIHVTTSLTDDMALRFGKENHGETPSLRAIRSTQ